MANEKSSSEKGSDERQASFERVLVTINGSENGKKAVETAIEVAKRFGSQLFILHVISAVSYHSEKLQREFAKSRKEAQRVDRGDAIPGQGRGSEGER